MSTGMTSAGSSTRSSTSMASGSCGSARPSACPGFNRLLRLAADDLRRRCQGRRGPDRGADPERDSAGAGHLRRAFAVPGDGRLSGRAPGPLRQPARRRRQASRSRRERPAVRRARQRISHDARTSGSGGEDDAMSTKPTVLLTGAAHGIGHATAMALARRGTPVGLIDRDADGARRARRTLERSGRDRRPRRGRRHRSARPDPRRSPTSRPRSGRSTSWSPAPASAP